jgi:hypothetical protein
VKVQKTEISDRKQGIKHNKADQINEDRVAKIMKDMYGIEMHQYAKLSPIDYWMEKDKKVWGVAELKTSTMQSKGYALLNMRKYVALQYVGAGFGCSAYFINQGIEGGVHICKVSDLKGETIIVDRGLQGKNEREPVMKIYLDDMYCIKEPNEKAGESND